MSGTGRRSEATSESLRLVCCAGNGSRISRYLNALLRLSPFALVQEGHSDPWRHLVCCLLISRTTGGPTVRAAILRFLQASDILFPLAPADLTPK